MTATNHALTGAVIALAIKRPELAIPLAFLSHFALDAIPHYNPPKLHARQFHALEVSWAKKFNDHTFRLIFATDMFLLALITLSLLLVNVANVSNWTLLFSIAAAILPDVIGGRVIIYRLIGHRRKNQRQTIFDKIHQWIQWLDAPWAITVEVAWFVVMAFLIYRLI